MENVFKKSPQLNNLVENSNFSTKISIYFATKGTDDSYDPSEKNYTYTNLNPLTIKGYVKDIKAESLIWQQYGLSEIGSKEIICKAKYLDWFKTCNKIVIDSDTYQVYRENVGNRVLITKLPCSLIKVILSKVR